MRTDPQSTPPGNRYDVRPYSATTRRVKRTIRRFDPWSVLKLSAIFYVALMVIGVIAATVLYYAARSVGIIENIENFVRGVGWPDFRLGAFEVMRVVFVLGAVQAILWTGFNLVVTVLYNLVADVVGGIEITMSERDTEAPS